MRRALRLVLNALALLALLTAIANAQQLVPYATARLTWTWAKGTTVGINDGDVTEFRVKCGPKPASYVTVTPIKDPAARQVLVRTVAPSTGIYYCAVTAANAHGESPPSNEVFFSAGAVASSPANLVVQ